MKKIYKLYLMLLLFVVGGVNALAITYTYDFEYYYSHAGKLKHEGRSYDNKYNLTANYWTTIECKKDVSSENYDEFYDVSRFASRNQDQRGWWFSNNGLRSWGSASELIIGNLRSGDIVTLKYTDTSGAVGRGTIWFCCVTNGKVFYTDQTGDRKFFTPGQVYGTNYWFSDLSETLVSEKSFQVTADCDLIVLGESGTVLQKVEIVRPDYGEYDVFDDPNNDFVNIFRFTKSGKIIDSDRVVTDVFGIDMTLGNPEITNNTVVDNELKVTIYDEKNNAHVERDQNQNWETSPFCQGTFYKFVPSVSGKLSIDGVCDNNGVYYFQERILDNNKWTRIGEINNTYNSSDNTPTDISLQAGRTYFLFAEGTNAYHLKSFTYEAKFHFPKKSIVIDDKFKKENPNAITESGGRTIFSAGQSIDDDANYTCVFKGGFKGSEIKSTEVVSVSDDGTTISWDSGIEGGAIVVTATNKHDETVKAQYVITIPYETYEWDFTTTEIKEELFNNTSYEKEWGLTWKVRKYEYENGIGYLGQLDHPVSSNTVRVEGDNARFIDGTAGLLFEANAYYWGTNIELNEKSSNYYPDTQGKKGIEAAKVTDEPLRKTLATYDLSDTYVNPDAVGKAVTMQVGSKITIPNLLPGQHIRIRWNRHNPSIGELMRATNVTDLDNTPMTGKVFNLGAGSHSTTVGHQEFIVENAENPGDKQTRVDVTFELLANGTVLEDENKTVIEGQTGWANIYNIKVGRVGKFLETHMNTVFADDKIPYDSEAEIITTPENVVANTNIDELDENGDIQSAYKRAGIYNYLRKSGKGIIQTKLDLYPENTDVINGSQIETYKIIKGSYTGTLNESNCYIGNKLTERFNPIEGDNETFRNREFQYLNVLFGEQENITEKHLKNADFKIDPQTDKNGWTIKNKQDWKNDGAIPVVEFYQSNFELSQEIELPAGDYCIAVNAFYRNGGKGDGTNNDNAWIYAGDKKQNIVALTDAGIGYDGKNDLYKAANAFKNGAFNNAVYFSLARGKKINIGFAGNLASDGSWCILGPVTLYRFDYSKGGDAHGSFTLALESRQIVDYNYCKNDFLLDSVHVKVNVYEYDYNVKPYPYTWAMEHFTTGTGNNTIEELKQDQPKETWNNKYNNNKENAVTEIRYWTADNSNGYRFNFGYPENMIAWKKRTSNEENKKTVQYAMKVGEKMLSGQAVPVKYGKETVATVIFGERYAGRANKAKENQKKYDNVPDYYKEGAVFKGAKKNSDIADYTAYTEGNEVNGQSDGGTFYTIIPKYDGEITVAVRLNDNKDFYIQENGVDLRTEKNIPEDPNNSSSKPYEYEFKVKEGQHYKIYADGSKLGFYGFKYTYKTGGELYVPEFDGLGIRPKEYWDEKDGLELKPNEGLVFGNKGYQLKVPEVKEGQTLYLAVKGDGVPTIDNNNSGLTVESLPKANNVAVYKVAGKGGDIDLNLANLTLQKMAVSVDEKSISSVGWATEAREYPLDITLAKQFLNEDLKAYKATGTTNDEKVIMEEVQYIPMTIDDNNTLTLNKIPEEGEASASTSENNGIVLNGNQGLWPLFTTDINREMSDMDKNLLVGVVSQANIYEEYQENGETKIKILDQNDKTGGPYNYMLATNGYKVKYVEDNRTEADIEHDEVVGKVSGLGFYLILKAGTKLGQYGTGTYTGGLPKDNAAYLKLPKRWAKINDKEIKEETDEDNSNGVHQVFFIDDNHIVTDINEVPIDDDEQPENVANLLQNGVFYTLQGIPVKNPTKGIYIFNGKKVYVK